MCVYAVCKCLLTWALVYTNRALPVRVRRIYFSICCLSSLFDGPEFESSIYLPASYYSSISIVVLTQYGEELIVQ
ncbi:hypothetical protein GGI35DRAFT_447132 [Trichoderma velutinum]